METDRTRSLRGSGRRKPEMVPHGNPSSKDHYPSIVLHLQAGEGSARGIGNGSPRANAFKGVAMP